MQWKNIIQKALEVSSKYVESKFRTQVQTNQKGTIEDVVTIVDIQNEKLIKEAIINELKKDVGFDMLEVGFLGEENLNEVKKYTFVMDPIDGTINYSAGIKYFGISIALFEGNEVIAAGVYHSLSGLIIVADLDSVYDTNGTKFLPDEEIASLEDTVIIHHLSKTPRIFEKNLRIIQELKPRCRGIRVMGSAVADLIEMIYPGELVVCNLGVYIWDIAAAKLILQNLGYCMLDLKGNELVLSPNKASQKTPFIAGKEKVVKEVLDIINPIID